MTGSEITGRALRCSATSLLAAAGLATLGCNDGSEQRYWSVRDSASVEIVEHAPSAASDVQQWTLGDVVSDIRQDESDPDRVWRRTIRGFWWGDRGMAVLMSDPPHVRVFDREGRMTLAFGGAGDGPGELRGPSWAAAYGDSAVVRDGAGLAIFGPDGTFYRRVAAPSESQSMIGQSEAGWLFAGHYPSPDAHAHPPRPQPPTARGFVVQLTRDGEFSDPLIQFETLLTWRVPVSLWGMLRHTAANGERIHVIGPDQFEISTYEQGQLSRIVRAPVPGIEGFTEAHFEVTRLAWGPIADLMIQQDRDADRLRVPAAVSMFATEQDDLWVRRTDEGPEAPARVWDVFDREGIWRATLETPPEFIIQDVRDAEVVGIWTDDYGVSGVRSYALVRTGVGS
ncbi:MAG TPA: hypothetical protein VMN60_02460 [Longimicrobiales bacterium]|nr:hypothetical protein [Longimicrobiales bacterium]